MELPVVGIGTLDVAASGQMPLLTLAQSLCGASMAEGAGLVTLDRTATYWMFEVRRPGFYLFRVASQDPKQPLERYTLNARLVPLPSAVLDQLPDLGGNFWDVDVVAGDSWLKGGEDDEIIEIDPDALAGGSGRGRAESTDDKRVEHEPAGGVSVLGHQVVRQLCDKRASDDHGDTMLCATPLQPGTEIAGAVRNDRGDDVDVFGFVLEGPAGALWTVDLTTLGETDTFGTLHDQHGHRLAEDDDGGSGPNFRILRNLLPGHYVVKVDGRHRAEGPYKLSVAVYSW